MLLFTGEEDIRVSFCYDLVLKMASFCLFSLFTGTNFVAFSGIWTKINGVEGEHADHLNSRNAHPLLPCFFTNLLCAPFPTYFGFLFVSVSVCLFVYLSLSQLASMSFCLYLLEISIANLGWSKSISN